MATIPARSTVSWDDSVAAVAIALPGTRQSRGCGDAACLASGGMASALRSGRLAGELVGDDFGDGACRRAGAQRFQRRLDVGYRGRQAGYDGVRCGRDNGFLDRKIDRLLPPKADYQ